VSLKSPSGELAAAPRSLLGLKLMQPAFSVTGPGLLLDTAADPLEQEAAMNLFKGTFEIVKDPTSHRAISYDNPVIAVPELSCRNHCCTNDLR
jgi:Protein of unknown function (Hypoth_ymh)